MSEEGKTFENAFSAIEELEKQNSKYKTQCEDEVKNIANNYNKLCESIRTEINNLKKAQEKFEQDKNLVNSIYFEQNIELNVGGHRYATTLNILRKYEDSFFGKMFSGNFEVKPSKDGSYFIERDGRNFYVILNYLRDGDVVVSGKDQMLIDELIKEAESFKLPGLVEKLRRHKTKYEEDMKTNISNQKKRI